MERRYIPYTVAKRRLAERLGATAREIAAWVFLGPDCGGLAAYTLDNDLDDPPRFSFDSLSLHYARDPSHDYLDALWSVYFLASDIEAFEPKDRFIAGDALIRRWSSDPEEPAEAFIRAGVAQGMLLPLHPGGVGTPWDGDEDPAPAAFALFCLAHVLACEAEYGVTPVLDAPKSIKPASKKAGHPIHPCHADAIALAAGVVRDSEDSDLRRESWRSLATEVSRLLSEGTGRKDLPSVETVIGWLKDAVESGRLKAEVEKGDSPCPDLSALSRRGRRPANQ
ncbi:MAG: hypothetical protein AB1648_07170 [Pseudomonadota bacterium]